VIEEVTKYLESVRKEARFVVIAGENLLFMKWLNETAPILRIETEESEEPILIQSGCRGTLVEVNNQIIGIVEKFQKN